MGKRRANGTALRHWHWVEPVFMANIVVLHGPAQLASEYMARRFGLEDTIGPLCDGRSLSLVCESGGCVYVMWVGSDAGDCLRTQYTVAHETGHVTGFILADREVEAPGGSEVWCYLQGYLVREVMRRLG